MFMLDIEQIGDIIVSKCEYTDPKFLFGELDDLQ